MVLQKRAPSLRRRPSLTRHVLRDGSLRGLNTQLQQFSVSSVLRIGDWPCSSGRISSLVSDYAWSTTLPTLPTPIETKSFSGPRNYCFRFHDYQRRAPLIPKRESSTQSKRSGNQRRTTAAGKQQFGNADGLKTPHGTR